MTALELTEGGGRLRRSDVGGQDPSRVLGGACAEAARRLNAPVGFLRGFVLVGAVLSAYVFWAYLVAVLVLPHRRRWWPGVSNVVGLLRVGLLMAVSLTTLSGSFGVNNLFDQSPQIWIPQAGLCLVTILALLVSGPENDGQDAGLAVAALVVAAVAGGLCLGMIAMPGVRWERAVSVVIVALGVALVVGGRRGRTRALLLPAVVAGSGALVLAASGARLQGGIGHLDARPMSLSAVHTSYRRAIGTINVDLSHLTARGRVVTLALSVGLGHIVVEIPAGAAVALDARIGRGTLMGPLVARITGVGMHEHRTYPPQAPTPASEPTLRLRLSAAVGIGSLSINPPGQGDG